MIHKEGLATLSIVGILILIILYFCSGICGSTCFYITAIILVGFYLFLMSFFRNPKRNIPQKNDALVYAPADGKVVVIEKAKDPEYYRDEERLQISIFMSPLNVHVNRSPISGKIIYKKYHKGKYLAAWNPKSSTENERCSIVIENGSKSILVKQIAGALARRIVNYMDVGLSIGQGEEIGFIKLGSRVDLFLPVDAKVKVEMNQMVSGNLDVIAEL